jgi:uncharacterized membrane protein YiaA
MTVTQQSSSGAGESQEELDRLRAEVNDLRAAVKQEPAPTRRRGGRWRTPLAITLIILGSILAPIAVLGFWGANEVSNTDRYVANMQPLISQPPIQDALTNQVTTAITNNVNVEAYASQAATELQQRDLPRLASLLQNFSGAIASGFSSAVHSAIARVVASPAMATVWSQANRSAHTAMVAVLSGRHDGAVKLVNGNVTLSLGPIIAKVKEQLTAQGLRIASLVPSNLNPTFTLVRAPNLEKAQAGYRLVTTLQWVLPLLSFGLLVLGVWAARNHRRGLIGAALGLAASMLVLAAALAIARVIYLNSVPQSVLPSDAAAAAYDTLVRFVKDGLRVLLLIGIVVALGAFLTGPADAAVKLRRGVASGIGWVRTGSGVKAGRFGEWVGANKAWLRIGALAIVAVIFVFSTPPSLALVIWLVLILLVLLGLIELFGGGKPAAATAPRPRAGT